MGKLLPAFPAPATKGHGTAAQFSSDLSEEHPHRVPSTLLSPASQQLLSGPFYPCPSQYNLLPTTPNLYFPPAFAFQLDLALAKTTSRSHLKATEGRWNRLTQGLQLE